MYENASSESKGRYDWKEPVKGLIMRVIAGVCPILQRLPGQGTQRLWFKGITLTIRPSKEPLTSPKWMARWAGRWAAVQGGESRNQKPRSKASRSRRIRSLESGNQNPETGPRPPLRCFEL